MRHTCLLALASRLKGSLFASRGPRQEVGANNAKSRRVPNPPLLMELDTTPLPLFCDGDHPLDVRFDT
jgi:hypothetical protein